MGGTTAAAREKPNMGWLDRARSEMRLTVLGGWSRVEHAAACSEAERGDVGSFQRLWRKAVLTDFGGSSTRSSPLFFRFSDFIFSFLSFSSCSYSSFLFILLVIILIVACLLIDGGGSFMGAFMENGC